MSQDPAAGCEAAPVSSFAEIRERAYDIWERHHRPEGFETQFWFMAQRELMAERTSAAGLDTSEPPPIPAEEVTEPNPDQIGEC
jgi:hypothetical protein